MRAVFGLVGVLVCIGVIVWIMGAPGGTLDHTKQVLDSGQKAREEVKQIAGITQDGLRVSETIMLEPQIEGGRLAYVMVAKLDAGSPMETHFGLKKNDCITEVNGLKIRDLSNGDPEMAKSLILEAYQRSQTITVARDNGDVVLPQPGQAKAAAAAATPSGNSSSESPAEPPKKSGDAMQRQLDAIQSTRMP